MPADDDHDDDDDDDDGPLQEGLQMMIMTRVTDPGHEQNVTFRFRKTDLFLGGIGFGFKNSWNR